MQERWLSMGSQKLFWFASDNRLGREDPCLELRARAPNGRLSAPRAVCFTDGPRYELENPRQSGMVMQSGFVGCTSQGLTWHDQRVSEHYPPLSDAEWAQRLGGPGLPLDASIDDGASIDARREDGSNELSDAGVSATVQASPAREVHESADGCSVSSAASGNATSADRTSKWVNP
jgi:hypothetical protein